LLKLLNLKDLSLDLFENGIFLTLIFLFLYLIILEFFAENGRLLKVILSNAALFYLNLFKLSIPLLHLFIFKLRKDVGIFGLLSGLIFFKYR
jgi:hypothetical protein